MFNIVELGSDITVLLGDDQQSNSILINCGESQVVVDTLCGKRDVARLQEIVCCQDSPLRYIVNTHWHSDHIGGNHELKGLFPESSIIAQESYLETIKAEEGLITGDQIPNPDDYPSPQITVVDHYEIIPGLMMINVGGHTKDSSIIYIQDKSIVICGDNLLCAGVQGGVSIPYFYWGNPHDLVRALERIRDFNPKILIPGHGWIVKPDILELHILYLQKLMGAYHEYCLSGDELPVQGELPQSLELENIMDCSKGVHWTFRKIHINNLRRLKELSRTKRSE